MNDLLNKHSRTFRHGTAASKGLIAFMSLLLVLGVVLYFNNTGTSQADDTSVDPGVAAAVETPALGTGVTPTTATPTTPTTATPTTATPTTATPGRPGVAAGMPAVQPPTPPRPTVLSADLATAFAYKDQGKLVEARDVFNNALLAGGLSENDTAAVKAAMREINQAVIFSPRRFNNDPWADSYKVQPGNRLTNIAKRFDLTWEMLGRMNGIDNPRQMRAGANLKAMKGPFHAVVSKSRFTFDVYLGAPGGPGSMYVTTFMVGLGEDSSTPTGTWLATAGGKLKNPEWTNPRTWEVIKADDPENPLGERWIALTGIEGDAVGKQSYGIHGTIEPQTIGTNASMGCIRLTNDNVMVVYDLLTDGKSTVKVVP
ncbi:MAG: L,D-transpeptidase family protein [Phycisphaerae bacterium]